MIRTLRYIKQAPRLHRGCLAFVIAFAGGMRPALGQSNATEAGRLFEEARAAMQSNDYQTACEKFAQSDRLDRALGTEFNLANCEEQRGRIATAWALFRKVRAELPADDRRIPVADTHIAALTPRVPRLRVILPSSAPPGMLIRIDGDGVATGALAEPIALDPGAHRVDVQFAAGPVQTRSIQLQEAQTVELHIPFANEHTTSVKPGETPEPRESSPPNREASKSTDDRVLGVDRRTVAFVVGGVGVAGFLAGTIAGLAGLHQESIGNANCSDTTRTCNQKGVDANNRARSLATVSMVGFAVGLVGVGLGGYLYVSAAPRPPSATARNSSPGLSLAWSTAW